MIRDCNMMLPIHSRGEPEMAALLTRDNVAISAYGDHEFGC